MKPKAAGRGPLGESMAAGPDEYEEVTLEKAYETVGLLITESRIPERSKKGRRDGEHIPQNASTHKICSDKNEECQKVKRYREAIGGLCRNGIPLCIEVLLCPRCEIDEGAKDIREKTTPVSHHTHDVGSAHSNSYVLLEQWTIQQVRSRADSKSQSLQNLCNAVRSHLCFSQLSAWLQMYQGVTPKHIFYRLTAPGEWFVHKFVMSPGGHKFPDAALGRSRFALRVTLSTLPRTSLTPHEISIASRDRLFAVKDASPLLRKSRSSYTNLGTTTDDDDDDESNGNQSVRSVTPNERKHTRSKSVRGLQDLAERNTSAESKPRLTAQRCLEYSEDMELAPHGASMSAVEKLASFSTLPTNSLNKLELISCATGNSSMKIPPPNRLVISSQKCASLKSPKVLFTRTAVRDNFFPVPSLNGSTDLISNLSSIDLESDSEGALVSDKSKPVFDIGAGDNTTARVRRQRLSHRKLEYNLDTDLESHETSSTKSGSISHTRDNVESSRLDSATEKLNNSNSALTSNQCDSLDSNNKYSSNRIDIECSGKEKIDSKKEDGNAVAERKPRLGSEDLPGHATHRARTREQSSNRVCNQAHSSNGICNREHSSNRVCGKENSSNGVSNREHSSNGVCNREHSSNRVCGKENSSNGICAREHLSDGIKRTSSFRNGVSAQSTPPNVDETCKVDRAESELKEMAAIKSPLTARRSRKPEEANNGVDGDNYEQISNTPVTNKKLQSLKQTQCQSNRSRLFKQRPLQSSPAPVKRVGRNNFGYDESITSVEAIKNALSCTSLTEHRDGQLRDSDQPSLTLSSSAPAFTTQTTLQSHSSLLGNFEESLLNGRIDPAGAVDGFTVDIGASGSFCPTHVSLPVDAYFFNSLSDDDAPSPYLGYVDLSQVSKRGYQIPRKGTLQITLFYPNHKVNKMFVVTYDLLDMPAKSQTFMRQKTIYAPCKEQNDSVSSSREVLYGPASAPDSSSSSDGKRKLPTYLRYLIHLRFLSTKTNKIFLHTDIRLIYARDKFEFDSRVASYELRSFIESPSNPKYSPWR